MRLFAFIAFILISCSAAAQSPDMLLLKKKGLIIATYSSGDHISFTMSNGAFVDGDIVRLQNDTIYVKEYSIKEVMTVLGTVVPDTVNAYQLQYSYKDIVSFPKNNRRFDITASGTSLLTGGILLTVASGVVYLSDRTKYSPGLLIAGVSLGFIGYIMNRLNHNEMKIGKKYTLYYLSPSSTGKN
jgi:hypothetical protein